MPIIRLFPQRIWLSLSILLCLPVFPRSTQAQSDEGGLRALFLLPETLGANYFLLRDAVEEYGWEVTQTAAVERITPCGFWGRFDEAIPLLPDQPLSAIDDITAFDCLVLAASPGNANPVPDPYGDIIASPPALELISTAVAAGLPVFTTCSGTRVLAAADVLRGRRVVGTPRFRDEYEAAGAEYVGNERNDTPPCISGNIITSARGQTYNLAQARAIATLIEDRQPRGGRRSGRTDHIGTAEAGFAAEGMVWSRTIGGSGADGARDLIATSDGGFLLTGYTFPPGASDADLLIVKTDAEGQIEWSRSFGGTGSEYGNACAEVADGYLVTGFTTSFGAGSRDLWVIRTDREGHEQWSRTFGGPSWEMGTSVLPRPDGHIVVCGSTHSFGAGEEDLWLLELGADGEQIRSRTYGGERIEIGSTVLPASDGGLLIAGTTLTYGGPNSDFWLLRTDAEGDTLWTRHYPARGPAGHAFDWCRAAAADARDGVLLVGYAFRGGRPQQADARCSPGR